MTDTKTILTLLKQQEAQYKREYERAKRQGRYPTDHNTSRAAGAYCAAVELREMVETLVQN